MFHKDLPIKWTIEKGMIISIWCTCQWNVTTRVRAMRIVVGLMVGLKAIWIMLDGEWKFTCLRLLLIWDHRRKKSCFGRKKYKEKKEWICRVPNEVAYSLLLVALFQGKWSVDRISGICEDWSHVGFDFKYAYLDWVIMGWVDSWKRRLVGRT